MIPTTNPLTSPTTAHDLRIAVNHTIGVSRPSAFEPSPPLSALPPRLSALDEQVEVRPNSLRRFQGSGSFRPMVELSAAKKTKNQA